MNCSEWHRARPASSHQRLFTNQAKVGVFTAALRGEKNDNFIKQLEKVNYELFSLCLAVMYYMIKNNVE